MMTHDGNATIPPLTFTIEGVPVQQGSKKGFSRKGSTIVQLVDDNADMLKPWRALVRSRASEVSTIWPQFEGPLAVTVDFYMPRGATVKRARPCVKPDLDKLVRALFDGITDSGLWGDDALVVDMHVREWYADDRKPGVDVTVRVADPHRVEQP